MSFPWNCGLIVIQPVRLILSGSVGKNIGRKTRRKYSDYLFGNSESDLTIVLLLMVSGQKSQPILLNWTMSQLLCQVD